MNKIEIRNSILRQILRKILKKEVIKMKKMILIAMAFVFVAALAPMAVAVDSANLSLQVTFGDDPPSDRITRLQARLAELEEQAMAEYDRAAENSEPSLIDVAVHNLLNIRDYEVAAVRTELRLIFVEDGDPTGQIQPILDEIASFTDTINDYIKKLQEHLPQISIELEGQNPWVLDSVKLGERRTNLNSFGTPMHKIHNMGNVYVSVSIGYAPIASIPENPQPGLEQGFNIFITMVRNIVIPPSSGAIPVVKNLAPTAGEPIPLTYGAPTGVMNNTSSMSTAYELKAYKAIGTVDPIVIES